MRSLPKTLFVFLILVTSTLFAQQSEEPYQILFPKDHLKSWSDTLEFTIDVQPDLRTVIAGTEVKPDTTGRIRYPVGLEPGKNVIPLEFLFSSTTYHDTLHITRMNIDHFDTSGAFINANIPDSLSIHIGYPRSGRYRRETVGLRGVTHPDAELFMNGDTVKVFPSGSFTKYLEIAEGENSFIFKAMLNGETVYDTLSLFRPIREWGQASPDKPLATETCRPWSERWVMAGDEVDLWFRGLEGGEAAYKVPGLTAWQDMVETAPGDYEAVWTVPEAAKEKDYTVVYRFKSPSGGDRYKNPNHIRVLHDPLGGMTIHPDSRVYDVANDNNLFFPLPDSIQVQVVGLERNFYRIQLSNTRTGYIKRDRVELDSRYRIGSPIMLGSMFADEDTTDWHVMRLYVGERRIPFEIKEKGVPLRLELKLYGAKQGWEWTNYPRYDSDIELIERSQPSDGVWQMNFYPTGSLFWGWYARYEGAYLVIGIRKPPILVQENVFNGIRIEIDPGHGGWQRGAIGITGYAEGDANLRYSKMLAEMLENAGATVFLTRTIDKQLDLPERAKMAREDSVHIFIWAHNNAPGGGRDLMEAYGSSTYYTWPSSKKISDKTYPHLGNMGIETSGKVARYYYYMTRQTEYLVYLIEGAFMTHPEEEMFLLSEEGLYKLATAAFNGLKDFLSEQAELQK